MNDNVSEEEKERQKSALILGYGFDILNKEDTLFTSRVNLLLVAESLLFLSYVTSLSNGNDFVSKIIVILGLFVSAIFLWVCWRHTEDLEQLKSDVEKVYIGYKWVRKGRVRTFYGIFSANVLMGVVLIWGFLFVWIILYINEIRNNIQCITDFDFLKLAVGFLLIWGFLLIAKPSIRRKLSKRLAYFSDKLKASGKLNDKSSIVIKIILFVVILIGWVLSSLIYFSRELYWYSFFIVLSVILIYVLIDHYKKKRFLKYGAVLILLVV